MKPVKHTINGRTYEIRPAKTDLGWEVVTFHEGKPAGPRYAVSFETAEDFRHYHAEPAVKMLVNIAKADLGGLRVK
jgi:hypothetical protein